MKPPGRAEPFAEVRDDDNVRSTRLSESAAPAPAPDRAQAEALRRAHVAEAAMTGVVLALVVVVAMNVALALILAVPAKRSREEKRVMAKWRALRPMFRATAATAMMELAAEIREINKANGWRVLEPEQWADTYKIPGILALIHSEVSEALEAFRTDDRANFEKELADVIIRVLDCAGGLGMDMDKAVAAKMDHNRHRGYRHGGKRV